VNGGPRLVRGGAIDIPAFAEGCHYPEDPAFLYRFGLRRNLRTLAGVRADGRLLLVTVDGAALRLQRRRALRGVGGAVASARRARRTRPDGGGSMTMTTGHAIRGGAPMRYPVGVRRQT
jgi:hypothetical protein